MIDELVDNLKALKYDPASAVDLYRHLYAESFFAALPLQPNELDWSGGSVFRKLNDTAKASEIAPLGQLCRSIAFYFN